MYLEIRTHPNKNKYAHKIYVYMYAGIHIYKIHNIYTNICKIKENMSIDLKERKGIISGGLGRRKGGEMI